MKNKYYKRKRATYLTNLIYKVIGMFISVALLKLIYPTIFTYKLNKFHIEPRFIYIFIFFILCIVFLPYIVNHIKIILRRRKYINSSIYQIDTMSGIDFEKYLDAFFSKMGYKVTLTPANNDYGADLILHKNNQKIVVQAKRYKNKVSNSAVQEIIGAKGFYKADSCIVITNSYFTKNAQLLAQKCNVELWDRTVLTNKFKEI